MSFWMNGMIVEDGEKPVFIEPPVYEVVRVIGGIPLFFHDHMLRLDQSLKLVGYESDFREHDYYIAIKSLVDSTGLFEHNFRLEIGLDGSDDLTAIVFPVPSFYPDRNQYDQGVKLASYTVVRENPHAKVYYKSYQEQIAELKKNLDVYEILLHDKFGKISEGSRSSVFFIKGDTIYSAKSSEILMGITRNKIIENLNDMDISFVEQDIYMSELDQYDACFISGTSIHVLPVQSIDQHEFGSSKNKVIRLLTQVFKDTVHADLEKTRRHYND